MSTNNAKLPETVPVLTERMRGLMRFLGRGDEACVPKHLVPSIWKAWDAGLVRLDSKDRLRMTRKGRVFVRPSAKKGR